MPVLSVVARSLRSLKSITPHVAGLCVLVLSACGPSESDGEWQVVFSDSAALEWNEQWFLEGDRAEVARVDGGLVLTAGPPSGRDSSHTVLWTLPSFSGDVKIEYEYTRLDTMFSVNAVNILYIQSTGLGTDDAPTDILLSTPYRDVPTMSKYFLGMNSLHVSYATTGPRRSHYVSARRYPAASKEDFEAGTQFEPVYEGIDLFEPGRSYRIQVVKTDASLRFDVASEDSTHTFTWDLTQFAPITEGRIGIRHMRGRSSRYRGFKVYERPD